ncbi:MAG: YbjQ family protein [Armatimonadetes bacterium]|nr:YbjQ family protein [Akkermansiaceae bacterium]
MLISTSENTGNLLITQNLGLVTGSVVWSKHIGRDIMAGLKTIIGGEIRGYTEMIMQARQVAHDRMQQHAAAIGADGIICVRLSTSSVMQGMVEVVAYGTAVKLAARQAPPLPG